MCGIIGIYGNPEAATLAYLGLYAQQHRGQEGAGIVSMDGTVVHRHMGEGLVSEVYHDPAALKRLAGASAIGHTRYSTTGGLDAKNVGPLLFNVRNEPVSIAHNGNLVNLTPLRSKLQAEGAIFQTTTDTELLVHLLARGPEEALADRLPRALEQVEGAYSLLILSPEGLLAARDPHGWRPLAIGKLKDTWVLASETCALDLIGAEELREVEPGEIVSITENGLRTVTHLPAAQQAYCIFEYIYFARPDSRIYGANVDKMRRRLGKALAREAPAPTADIVIAVPDSSNTAAIGYAQESGLRHDIGLIRNHYVGRSFIHPQQELRDLTVKLKFNPVRGVLEGKEVVVVDDSIVRGTTMRSLVKLLRQAGVQKVHVRISSPPIHHSCYFGLDFPTSEELIAGSRTSAAIATYLGVDSLAYLSMEGLLGSMDHDPSHFCTACFSGKYPVEIHDIPRKDMFETASSAVSAELPAG